MGDPNPPTLIHIAGTNSNLPHYLIQLHNILQKAVDFLYG